MSEVGASGSISRSARIALLVSLALNVLLVAVLVGGMLGKHWHGDPGRGRGGAGLPHFGELRSFTRALPPPRAAEFDRIMQARRDTVRARIVELVRARRAVHAVIAGEPFQRARLDAALLRLRTAEHEAAQEAQALLAEMLELSTAQERTQLVELMQSRSARRGRHPSSGRHGGPQTPAEQAPAAASPEPPAAPAGG